MLTVPSLVLWTAACVMIKTACTIDQAIEEMFLPTVNDIWLYISKFKILC